MSTNQDAKFIPGRPAPGAVILFTVAICAVILLVIIGTGTAIYTATRHADVTRGQLQAVISKQQQIITEQQKELHSDCQFWDLLAEAPLPAGVKPSKLGVSIITSSRVAFLGHNCGILHPPGAALTRWATYYHLPIQ